MKKFFCALCALIISLTAALPAFAAENETVNIDKNDVKNEVSQTLYGVSLEDVNYACDGGLVANLVNNGSFEDENKPENAWIFDNIEAVLSQDDSLNKNNPNYETLTVDGEGRIENIGFTELYKENSFKYDSGSAEKADMGFKKGSTYDFSCFVKNVDFEGAISVYLNSKTNSKNVVRLSTNGVSASEWTKLSAVLKSREDEDGSLVIVFEGEGTIKFDFATLVPQDSYGSGNEEWKYVSLRSDMYEVLKNLNPSFVRFPGGALVEGRDVKNIYSWKDTIGALEERRQSDNIHSKANGGRYYVNTNAMGYHEYFQLCEDLGAKAVPVVNAGMASQTEGDFANLVHAYNKLNMNDEAWEAYLINELGYDEKDKNGMAQFTSEVEALEIKSKADYEAKLESLVLSPDSDEFKNYVQDILDLVEYATASATTSYWGALRAANGHEQPFNLDYLAIGSDNYGEMYFKNVKAIYKAVHKRYPKLKIVLSGSADAQGSDYETALQNANSNYKKSIVNENINMPAEWFCENTDRYDSYDRQGADVAVGALSVEPEKKNEVLSCTNIQTSLAIGAFLTGAERNSDIVKMVSITPAFSKYRAGSTNGAEVWFDSQDTALTTDYYTQLMFANNTGTKYIDTGFSSENGIFESTTVDESKKVLYVKLVNTGKAGKININLSGYNSTYASLMSLSHKYKTAYNDIGRQAAAPKEKSVEVKNNSLTVSLEANSVNVVRIALDDNSGDNFYTFPDEMKLKTDNFVPTTAKVGMFVIAACLLVGMVAGYLIYSKVLSKNKKGK
ncbi:MAG: hypothetical protein IJS03_00935 [Eubacterium sp.]|nr:hypothetical protein [Eubacterium sp.]